MHQRLYEETHPWISFKYDPTKINTHTLFDLGEALSKCDHVSGAPLPPAIAQNLNQVFLTKGVHATTSIEGNTLSEEEVGRRLDGDLQLPDSLEYQGEEIDNLIDVFNEINDECISGQLTPLSVEKIKEWNKALLKGQPLEDRVVPGEFREFSVVVGDVYRGAPAEDCDFLMDRFIKFINEEMRTDDPTWERPIGIVRAILAHLYLAWIHPFGDGNGRTARLIEFHLLLEAGIPVPAAHLLSDYYNRSRARYYLSLEKASKLENRNEGVSQFISYAVTGFVEGLRQQIDDIENQQIEIAWVSYVHEVFHASPHNDTWKRRRQLALTTPFSNKEENAIARSDLPKQSMALMEMYAGTSSKTLTRDINELVSLGLLRRVGKKFSSNKGRMAAFLPATIEIPR